MSCNYIITDGVATVILDGRVLTINAADKRYADLVEALQKDADEADVLAIIEAPKRAAEKAVEGTKLSVVDGAVLYEGRALAAELSARLLRLLEGGYSLKPLANFVERLFRNPSRRAVQELYQFLEYGKLPLTPDGCFIGYKVVRPDYMDKHSGTFNNAVGQVCEMPRNAVDDDSTRTCSFGLHVCSAEYLKSFYSHGDHVMLVKVDPANVVSIPVDYNNTKLRCCRYEVIGEYENYAKDYDVADSKPTFDTEVYGDDDEDRRGNYDDGYDAGYSDGYNAGRVVGEDGAESE